MKRTIALAVLGALFAAGAAMAGLKADTPVYVRTRDTRIFKDPKQTSAVVSTVQPGDKLAYQEQATPPQFHKVKLANGKVGYVWYQNISTVQPKGELVMDKATGKAKNVDAQAFASYGAAARGVTEGARQTTKTVGKPELTQQFDTLEKIAAQVKADKKALEKHREQAKLAAEVAP